jgi:hypothetical protein
MLASHVSKPCGLAMLFKAKVMISLGQKEKVLSSGIMA